MKFHSQFHIYNNLIRLILLLSIIFNSHSLTAQEQLCQQCTPITINKISVQIRSGFSVYAKSNQSFPADFPKPILFDTESFDTNNNFENSSFTATEAGYYFFGANLSWQATIHSEVSSHGVVVEMKVKDLTNNSKTITSSTVPLTTNFITTHQISNLVYLKVGDKVSLTIASLGSTATILKLVNDFAGSSFYGYRVF